MTKTVEQIKATNHLIEIMQQNKTQFALAGYDEATNKVIQCHQFVHCRDFMLDALASLETNKPVRIYGFTYSSENPRPWKDGLSLLVKFEDAGALKKFQTNFQVLKDIEAFLGWEISLPELVEYPEDKKGTVVWIIGDPRWCKTALAFSLYTYLIKCLTFEIPDLAKWKEAVLKTPTKEAQYMDTSYMNWLLTNLNEVIAKYENFSGFKEQEKKSIHLIHDNSGFVTVKELIWNRKEYVLSQMKEHVLYGMNAKAA
jgi:hypothetical protein